MAVKNTAGTSFLTRSTGSFPVVTSNFTVFIKFKLISPAPSSFRTLFAFFQGIDDYSDSYFWLGTQAGNSNLQLEATVDSSPAIDTTPITITQDVWNWAAVQYNSSLKVLTFIINGEFQASYLGIDWITGTPTVFSTLDLLADSGSDTHDGNVSVAKFRCWQASLNSDELWDEASSVLAVRTANLMFDYSLDTNADLTDDSGHTVALTAVGSPATDASGPTYIASSTSATAVNIASIPSSSTLDTKGNRAWWKYTAVAGDVVLGFWFFGDLVTFKPTTEVFSPDAVTEYKSGNYLSVNKPIQVPVTVGDTYYFRVTPNNIANVTSTVAVNSQRAPNTAAPVGSLYIPDDVDGFPLAVISTTGTILQYRYPFPNGNYGDAVIGGKMLVSDHENNQQKLFDNNLNLITAVAVPGSNPPIGTDRNTKFYVVNSSSGLLHLVDNFGIISGLTWNLPFNSGIAGIAPNAANTIVYYTSTGDATVRRFDLIGNAPLSNLAGSVAGYTNSDVIVLADGTIVVAFIKTSGSPRDVFARRYDPSGTVLNTYSLGAIGNNEANRLTYALDDPNSFWMWTNLSTFFARFNNIKASDGSILHTFDLPLYTHGVYAPVASATPTRFGISDSCPIILKPLNSGTLPPNGGGSGTTGTIIVTKVTVPFGDTTQFTVATTNLPNSLFNIQSGQQFIFDGLNPGSGYVVIETEREGWMTSYQVSNGSPYNNISVSSSETVTVTITNVFKSPFSGIYYLKPKKTNDTLYSSLTNDGVTIFASTTVVKFPDPRILL